MQLTGDDGAIAELKKLAADDKDYLKFLIGEARSNTDHATSYRGKNGVKYALNLDLGTGTITVQPG